MPISVHVRRDFGHPWDRRPGFDLLVIDAESQVELDRAVECAESKFWQPWLLGTNETTGKPGGVLYKPCGIDAPWDDSPEGRHPGRCERNEK